MVTTTKDTYDTVTTSTYT